MKRVALIAASAALISGCSNQATPEVREELVAMIFACSLYEQGSTEKVIDHVRYTKFDFIENTVSYSDSVDGVYEPFDLEKKSMAYYNFKVVVDEDRVLLRGIDTLDNTQSNFFVDRFTGRVGVERIIPDNPAMNTTTYWGECEFVKEDRRENEAMF